SCLERLGQFNVMSNIFDTLRRSNRHAFGMYLAGRTYRRLPRDPSIPFGFLLNLAARLPLLGTPPGDGNSWVQGLNLARDIVAALDVEPYHQFTTINP